MDNMKLFFVLSTLSGLIALSHSAIESPEVKLIKLTPTADGQHIYTDNTVVADGDLTASASDRTFHINKDGRGGYPGGSWYPYGGYGSNPGIIYPGGYRGGSLSPGYRGWAGPGYGGNNIGYGYYGNSGLYPGGYGGYGGYRGYGGYGGGYGSGYGGYGGYGGLGGLGGLGGYGGYRGYGDYGIGGYPSGGYGGYGNYGIGGYDDGYPGYGRSNYGRYGGSSTYDGYGYGTSNIQSDSTYGTRSYGGSGATPTGYRGYS